MHPRLGVLVYSDYPISEIAGLAKRCEELGYGTFWYTDVRFARECYVGLAAAAAVTKTIRLGPGVTDPYSRHPALTASAIASIDEVSNGRAVLGLGTGGAGFKELGFERKLPVAALRETVEMIRGLLAGEEVTLEGKVVSIKGGKLSFKPPRTAIPVYFATHGAQITQLAGRIADGVLIANTLQPKAFDFYVGQIDKGLEKDGRPKSAIDIGLRVEAAISDNDEAAYAVMRRRVTQRVLQQYPHWDYLDELGIALPDEFVAMAKDQKSGVIDQAAPLMPREVVESMVLAGNADRCAEQLARALGPRISSVTVRAHAVKGQAYKEVLESFATKVFPKAVALAKSNRT